MLSVNGSRESSSIMRGSAPVSAQVRFSRLYQGSVGIIGPRLPV